MEFRQKHFRLVLLLGATLLGWGPLFAASPAFNYLTPPIEITPSANNTWEDVDTSVLLVAGVSGVIVQFDNNGLANSDWGVRPKGSVRAFFIDGAKSDQQGFVMTGTNASGVFQVYSGDTAAVKTYIVGYTMSGVTFFTEPIDKTVPADNLWYDVDISVETGGDTAIGAIFTVITNAGASRSYALRKKGSTDDRFSDLRAETPTLGLIGVDANELAEMRLESLGGLEVRLEGYVTDGAVFFDNATPKSTGTTGSYQSVDITGDLLGGDLANGAIVEIHLAANNRDNLALRHPANSSYDVFTETSHGFAAVGIDATDIFEQKIDTTDMDLYLVGYTLERDWWDDNWNSRIKITFDNSGQPENLLDFPVLVCIDSSKLGYGATEDLGEDVRFLDSNNSTVLAHEIEQWNESGSSYVWVRVPQIDASSSTDFIYMYFQNAGAPDGQAPGCSVDPVNCVWKNGYESVYHLHDDFNDSTGLQTPGTNVGSTDGTANRLAGDYQRFDASETQYVNLNWTPSYAASQDFTWSGWVNLDSNPAPGQIRNSDDILGIEDRFGCPTQCGAGPGDGSELRFAIREGAGGAPNPVDQWDVTIDADPSGPPNYMNLTPQALSAGWHYVAMMRDGATARTYLDGLEVDSAAVSTGALTFSTLWTGPTNTLVMGAQWQTDVDPTTLRNWFLGDMDEVRTATVKRTPNWIKAQNLCVRCQFTDFGPAITAVELMSFEARGLDGSVELTWETGSELNNLGFHVHRATSRDGRYQRITPSVIPGLGSSPMGASYTYRDTSVAAAVTYYYKLEDIETTGKTEFHGPVSATPMAGVSSAGGESGSTDGASGEDNPSSLITYGNPSANAWRVVQRDRRGVVLELETAGFFATPQDDGTVRLEVPGFAALTEANAPQIPVKRSWVAAVAGRKVKLVSVRAFRVEAFSSLRPTDADLTELVASGDGTVRARRSAKNERRRARAAFRGDGLYPSEAARIVNVGFQGDVKKALVELSPLRWDASTGQLLLARRLVVRLSFRGRERSEETADGLRGRRRPARRVRGGVFARLVTEQRGLYAVSFKDLFARRRRPIPAAKLRLSRQGTTVAYHLEPRSDRFGPGSTLYFVSEGATLNPYGNEAVYELALARGGQTMVEADASPAGEAVAYYWRTLRLEQNRYYQAALLEAPDRWLWELVMAPATKSFPFDVDALASTTEASRVSVWLQGASDLPAFPDHHVRLYVNGTFVGEASWDGKRAQRLDAEFSPGLLQEGQNILEIENVGDTGASYSMVMVDRFEVRFPRLPRAIGGAVDGVWSESGVAEVSGLELAHVPGALLLDTTQASPLWLSGAEMGEDGVVRFRTEAGRSYWTVSPSAVSRPVVEKVARTGLARKSNRADYLVIAPEAFIPTLQPLVELRRSQGLRVKAVAMEDIYSEFGFGETTPEAVKDFLSYAYHHWRAPAPRYVVLVGDATYDFKDHLDTGIPNHVPPRMVKTTYLWTASDPSYAAVNGEDILPDFAIGRLPAATLAEARAMVQKIVAYESGDAGVTRAPVVLVADNPDLAGNFVADADTLADGLLQNRTIQKIYLSELGVAGTRASILQAFDDGAGVVSYLGHGGIHLWASENVFNIGDAPSLSPQAQQPLLLTMNCLNGYYHFPYFDSLAEALLKTEDKGAIAAFSPSGLSLNGPANRYHQALLHELFSGRHRRLGDAVLAAQESYADTGAFPELLSIYNLLGDPALTLR